MKLLKNKLSKFAMLFLIGVIVVSFNDKAFVFDGGTINNPNITIIGAAVPVVVTATSASGCAGAVNYQWQQSFDMVNFTDILNATDTLYQSVPVMNTTYFRRKAICGGEYVYTNNIATIMVAPSVKLN